MNSSLAACEKLSFFRKVYISSKRPPYIDICKFKNERSVISKFRLSAHTLAIEKGRYKNIERANRVCLSCNGGDIEDEYHFFSMCPHYSSQRNSYCDKIKTKCPFLLRKYHFTIKEMSIILNNNSIEILKLTVKFMNECLSIRSE